MNQRQLVSFVRACAFASGLFGMACGDGEDGGPQSQSQAIEIAGTWESNFGGTETISSESWGFDGGTAAIVADYDNAENFAVTRNPDDAEFSPGLYNRIVWTEPSDDSFYYCTVAFGLDSLDDALASTETADDSDPENSGCGGMFAWTKLSK
jgi:hypothetical protein